MKPHVVPALLAMLVLSACATTATTPPPAVTAAYDQSIYQAAVFRPENLRQLRRVVADEHGEVTVTTLKGSAWDVGPTVLRGPVWVTLVPEVQERCRTFEGDVAMRLRQLLGLQPNQTVSVFVTMQVRAADMFRPTPDPRIDTIYPCIDPATRSGCNEFPKDVDPAHKQWMAETFLTLQIPNGYPWTHLGYTRDWAPGADPYGASEYLVRGGATVKVTRVDTIADYCRR